MMMPDGRMMTSNGRRYSFSTDSLNSMLRTVVFLVTEDRPPIVPCPRTTMTDAIYSTYFKSDSVGTIRTTSKNGTT